MFISQITRVLVLSATACLMLACGAADAPTITKSVPEVKPEQSVKQDVIDPKTTLFNKRAADLKKLNTALQQYFANNGKYPSTSDGKWASIFHTPETLDTAWLPGLVPDYIDETPVDPESEFDVNAAQYLYRSNGSGYKLIAHRTDDCDLLDDSSAAKADPKRSNGGACWAWGYFTADHASL